MRARRPDSSDGYRRRFRHGCAPRGGPPAAGANESADANGLVHLTAFTMADWGRTLEWLTAPVVSLDDVLVLCTALVAVEASPDVSPDAWPCVAPAEVYAALRAVRDDYPPGMWAVHVAAALVALQLPEGATFADVVAAQFIDPTRAGDEDALMIEAGAAAYRAGAWVTLRLGGPPDLAAVPPAPDGASPS